MNNWVTPTSAWWQFAWVESISRCNEGVWSRKALAVFKKPEFGNDKFIADDCFNTQASLTWILAVCFLMMQHMSDAFATSVGHIKENISKWKKIHTRTNSSSYFAHCLCSAFFVFLWSCMKPGLEAWTAEAPDTERVKRRMVLMLYST